MPDAATTTATYTVEGVGSAHCQSIVAKAIGGLDHVISVDVEIGTGRTTVTTTGAPDDQLIADTVDDAGYTFAGRA
ncbi:cation transporter [Streptomyces sp. NPDC001691]|uniref:cation transporter n=1 Tax=unclassified Streptomyces TaxID=2593676 RepID=UPI000DE9017E|nr:cation transporter [Streptomyces sp. SDr-06]RCH66041.1 hypothetical protein DT019_24795 [Streptomyces sp. SDr-06]